MPERYAVSNDMSAARAARHQQFLEAADPDGDLTPEQREQAAAEARSQHLRRAALIGSAKRKRRVAQRYLDEAAAAEAEAEQIPARAS